MTKPSKTAPLHSDDDKSSQPDSFARDVSGAPGLGPGGFGAHPSAQKKPSEPSILAPEQDRDPQRARDFE